VNTSSLSDLPSPTTHTQDGSLAYIPSSTPVSSLIISWLGVVTTRAVLLICSWIILVWVTGTDRMRGGLVNFVCKRNNNYYYVDFFFFRLSSKLFLVREQKMRTFQNILNCISLAIIFHSIT